MAPFALSLAWRILRQELDEGWAEHWPGTIPVLARERERLWREKLVQERAHDVQDSLHVLSLGSHGTPSSGLLSMLPSNWNRYLDMALDGTVAVPRNNPTAPLQSAFSYVKIGRLIVIGFIKETGIEQKRTRWKGTRLKRKGETTPPHSTVSGGLLEFIASRAYQGGRALDRMSMKQRQEILSRLSSLSAGQKLPETTFAALERDLEIFGPEAVFGPLKLPPGLFRWSLESSEGWGREARSD